MCLRNTASPPIEIASSEAPWKLSHSDSVLCRPVARRASFSAIPIASVPPGANSTLPRGSGARATSFDARSTAAALVNRRGANGSVSSWRRTAAMTCG